MIDARHLSHTNVRDAVLAVSSVAQETRRELLVEETAARRGTLGGIDRVHRGRFGNYVPPVLEALDLAEVEETARNNRMRAIWI